MKIPEKLCVDELTGRDLYFLKMEGPGELSKDIKLPGPYFICLIVWDAKSANVETISEFVKVLLDKGACYICVWGRDCERVHDTIDELCEFRDQTHEPDMAIMTTWHDHESLDDTIWFFLTVTLPDENYIDDCRSSLAITVGMEQKYIDRIMIALKSPREFDPDKFDKKDKLF